MIQRYALAVFLLGLLLSLPACAVDHSSGAALSPPLPLHWWRMRPPMRVHITAGSPHRIDDALRVDMKMRITLDLTDATLEQAVQAVWRATRIKLWMSPSVYRLTLRPITYRASEVPLQEALDQILRAAQPAADTLVIQLQRDVILITTTADAGGYNPAATLETWIYDCHWIAWIGFPSGGRTMHEWEDEIPWDLMDELKTALRDIEPGAWVGNHAWVEHGGPGSMDEFNGTLIITQTPRIHAQITAMLNALYRMRLAEIQSTF